MTDEEQGTVRAMSHPVPPGRVAHGGQAPAPRGRLKIVRLGHGQPAENQREARDAL